MPLQRNILQLLLWAPVLLSGKTENQPIDLLGKENSPKWRGYDGKTLPPGWMVSDSMLWVDENKIRGDKVNEANYTGSRDVIFAGQEFEYFELSIQWKIAKGGNSGIFYHLKEGFGDPSSLAPEYQLIDDENYASMHPDLKQYNAQFGVKNPELLQDWQKTGADYAMHTANEKEKILHPAGEWNTTKIVVGRGKTEHWLNGKKILSFEPGSADWHKRKNEGKWKKSENYSKFKTGYIGLQYHGSSLWFRNIKITPL